MSPPDAAAAVPRHPLVLLPCAESCAYFRQINPDRWSEFGLCTNPRAPFRGYPIRLGRNCRHFTMNEPQRPTPVGSGF